MIYSNSARDFAFAINIFKFGGNASAAASECIEIFDVLEYPVLLLCNDLTDPGDLTSVLRSQIPCEMWHKNSLCFVSNSSNCSE